MREEEDAGERNKSKRDSGSFASAEWNDQTGACTNPFSETRN